jgi:hypothetical protein
MRHGQARTGQFVFFTVDPATEKEPPVRIVRGEIQTIIFPGTTNEYFSLVELLSDGRSRLYEKKPTECYASSELARKAEILRIHLQVETLRDRLKALGDHSLADSRWRRRRSA